MNTLGTLVFAPEPIHFLFQQAESGNQPQLGLFTYLMLGTVVAVTLIFLIFGTLQSRRRAAEQKLEILRELARQGQVSEAQADEFLRPKLSLTNAVLVLAWFGFVAGIALVAVALFEDWPHAYSDYGAPGMAITISALAIMSVPVVLRELRRQGVG